MVVLITGASHTGKTLLAQKLLATHRFPYLSLDLLKMGLIRSGNTDLSPEDTDGLTAYLWPIAREMIKTALENRQDLVVEGCYIPFDWEADFPEAYRKQIRFVCLVMSETYIRQHFDAIQKYANAAEHRLDDTACTLDFVLEENARFEKLCQAHPCHCIRIDDRYAVDLVFPER